MKVIKKLVKRSDKTKHRKETHEKKRKSETEKKKSKQTISPRSYISL